jgi:hypothetical protein
MVLLDFAIGDADELCRLDIDVARICFGWSKSTAMALDLRPIGPSIAMAASTFAVSLEFGLLPLYATRYSETAEMVSDASLTS